MEQNEKGFYKIIKAGDAGSGNSLRQIWNYRSLLWAFVKRDLKSRYTETALGFFWAVLQPVIGLLVFTFFFDKLLKINTGNIPYPVFALTGMSAWYYFVYLVNNGGSSLIQMEHIIKKVKFPRLLCPISKAVSGLADFVISVILVLFLMMVYRQIPSYFILLIPFFATLLALTGLSVGIWLCSLTVRYKDLHHVVPYLISFAIWVTPVFYPATILPEKYFFIMYFNPMAAIIEGLRWALAGGKIPDMMYMVSFIPVGILFLTGILYFNKVEGKIAEII